MDAAARIKPDRAAVRDEERKAEVKANVAAAASEAGVDRALMSRLCEDLIETSIAYEFVVVRRDATASARRGRDQRADDPAHAP